MTDLKAFWATLTFEQRERLAAQCLTTYGSLRNVVYGLRPCPEKLASLLESASNGLVRRWSLRPDDWAAIWPELVGAEGAPSAPADTAPQARVA